MKNKLFPKIQSVNSTNIVTVNLIDFNWTIDNEEIKLIDWIYWYYKFKYIDTELQKLHWEWWISDDGVIIAKGFSKVDPFFWWPWKEELKAKFRSGEIKWILTPNFHNNFSVFKVDKWLSIIMDIGDEWWVKNDWTILSLWYTKCYPFDEDINWFAKFEKKYRAKNTHWYNLRTWYIDINWRIFTDIKKIDWKIYLKKDDKWFLENFIKIN